MIIAVKTYLDKKAYLMIPDPYVFAGAFNLIASEFLESELEKIQGKVERKLTKKEFDLEIEKLPIVLKKYSQNFLVAGIEAEFEFNDFAELIITLRGTSSIVTSTSFH